MALNERIFGTDPRQAKPKPRCATGIVGWFRSGRLEGRMPVALDKWRVICGDPEVAEQVAVIMGGEPKVWDTAGEDNLEVLTNSDAVKVIVAGADAIESNLDLLGMNGGAIHHCDGVAFLDADRKGEPCDFPKYLADCKAAARSGRGPGPDIRITFRLADTPGLGKFCMRSGMWDLVGALHEYLSALHNVAGPALCTLKLETVSFVLGPGPMEGRTVKYNRPTLSVRGAAPAAVGSSR